MTIRFLSVCSGIEAASVAWHSLGWQCAGLSEIEAFPRAVLEHRQGAQAVDWDHRHTPQSNTLPLFGDFTQIESYHVGPIDLLVGGTPCQSFSIAGLRGGLDDDRGNLALEFLRLADRTRPRWVVWENVPGVLSSNGGRDFGAILGGLVELGYGFAYRVLDAQHFGVPQRRRRVFVVGHLGSWTRAAAVLFERHSLQGHPAPRREAREGAPGFTAGSFGGYCEGVGSLRAQGGDYGGGTETLIAHTLRGEGFDASEDGTGRGTPLVPVAFNLRGREDGAQPEADPDNLAALRAASGGSSRSYIAFSAKDHGADAMEDCSPTLRAGGHSKSHANAGVMPAVAFAIQERAVSENLENGPQGRGYQEGVAYTLEARNKVQSVAASAVRRLTPTECERLQGFPDGYTAIPWRGKGADQCPDGPRYKALGNSMAVPCMAWIGERIAAVEAIINREEAA